RVTAAFEKTVQGIARLAAGGGGRTVIHLRPANLGTIRLEVRVEHAVATASAIVETTAVRSAIEQNMHELRATLAEQGIRLDQFDVRDGSARQHAEADPRAFDEAPLPARAASIAPEEETDLRPAARRHPGRVSVTV
ncbi:flagellar hook-length control protein FliK, partial [bacterium]|nr:flagellar hook-length control protein FliK [bacterium]